MMTDDQVKALLAVAAAYDDRKPDRAQITAWATTLGDLPFSECRDAVIAYYGGAHSRRVQPGDVRDMVTAARRDRLGRSGWSAARPPVDPDDVNAYQQWLRDGATSAAEEPPPARAITPGTGAPSSNVRPLLDAAREQCTQASSRVHSGHTRPNASTSGQPHDAAPDNPTQRN